MNETGRELPMDRLAREARAKYPDPGTTPIEHLRHTVAVYAGEPDTMKALVATGSIYGPSGTLTGLDLGDLRALLAILDRYDGGPGDVLSSPEYRAAYGVASESSR